MIREEFDTDEVVEDWTGIPRDQLFEIARKAGLGESFAQLVAICRYLKHGGTQKHSCTLYYMLTGEKAPSEKTFRRWIDDWGAALMETVNPGIRFQEMDKRFPNCTFLVDGTTIPTVRRDTEKDYNGERIGNDRNYSGKHDDIVWKIEIWVTMRGTPIA